MSAARYLPRKLLFVLLSLLLVLSLTAPAWAQYSIPDCLVAAINGLLPDEGFAASRDQAYKEYSGKWNTETAGLSPEQLQGYRTYFCASFTVADVGAEADGSHNISVGWPSVDGYLASIGQRRGQGGGSSSGSTGSTGGTTGGSTGSTGSGTSGSAGTTGSSGKLSAGGGDPTALATVAADDLLFDAGFETMPENFVIRDFDDNLIDSTMAIDGSDTVLKIQSDANRTIALTGSDAAAWTDYAVEARLKVKDGTLILSTRTAADGCSSYDFYIDPTNLYGSLEKSDSNCDSTVIQDRSDLSGVKANKWFTLRVDAIGDQLTASVNGSKVLSGSDSGYAEGYPALYLFPDEGKTATLEIDALRVLTVQPPPDTLADYNKSPAEAIAELQALGQLPSDKGTLIFQQKSAFASGSGFHFYAMAARSPRTDIVISATLKFRSAGTDDTEYCALTARLGDSNGGTKSAIIGFDNRGYLTFVDADSSSSDGVSLISDAPDYPPGESYNLLVTLIGEKAVIYVDGARVLASDQLVPHAGTYALVLLGANGNSRCDASNFWAYSFK